MTHDDLTIELQKLTDDISALIKERFKGRSDFNSMLFLINENEEGATMGLMSTIPPQDAVLHVVEWLGYTVQTFDAETLQNINELLGEALNRGRQGVKTSEYEP